MLLHTFIVCYFTGFIPILQGSQNNMTKRRKCQLKSLPNKDLQSILCLIPWLTVSHGSVLWARHFLASRDDRYTVTAISHRPPTFPGHGFGARFQSFLVWQVSGDRHEHPTSHSWAMDRVTRPPLFTNGLHRAAAGQGVTTTESTIGPCSAIC